MSYPGYNWCPKEIYLMFLEFADVKTEGEAEFDFLRAFPDSNNRYLRCCGLHPDCNKLISEYAWKPQRCDSCFLLLPNSRFSGSPSTCLECLLNIGPLWKQHCAGFSWISSRMPTGYTLTPYNIIHERYGLEVPSALQRCYMSQLTLTDEPEELEPFRVRKWLVLMKVFLEDYDMPKQFMDRHEVDAIKCCYMVNYADEYPASQYNRLASKFNMIGC